MPRTLLLSVRFHDGRYHGAGGWPPSPARLFQALVAGAARGGVLLEEDRAALAWLETLEAPRIATPPVRLGKGFTNYVPNNDLDAVGSDPRRVGEIRAGKVIHPTLLDPEVPLLYAWTVDGVTDTGHAHRVCAIAERLYQFGWGVDMAWARGEVLDDSDVEARLAHQRYVLYQPTGGSGGSALLCPQIGSLTSLEQRFTATRGRFTRIGTGRNAQRLFSQAPRPRFAPILYDSPPQRLLFELRASTPNAPFAPCGLADTAGLVLRLRDAAVAQLKAALPQEQAVIERVLIGRGATEADKAARVRIVPLPSIGHRHADRAIRRVLIEIPPNCPLPIDDLAWGFSGLEAESDPDTGEVLSSLVPAADRGMLAHYGVIEPGQAGFRVWRTVTPMAVPAARRRGQVGGRERASDEAQAVQAVRQALRHAGIAAAVDGIRVQREPWSGKGTRAEAFAPGSRFGAARLWHVEIRFVDPVAGPLAIGDGRYLGLGLMQRVEDAARDALVFPIREGTRPPAAQSETVVNALRRALMSRAADADRHVSPLFSGHEADAGPARSGHHRHVYLFADDSDGDGLLDRVGILAPWRVDRSWRPDRKTRVEFDRVASGLRSIRAGSAGLLALDPPGEPDDGDPLFARARAWTSRTPYLSTRYPKRRVDARVAAADDLQLECDRRGLPRPRVEIVKVEASPRGGIEILARLHFHTTVAGPILLGRDAHRGGGLFAAQR